MFKDSSYMSIRGCTNFSLKALYMSMGIYMGIPSGPAVFPLFIIAIAFNNSSIDSGDLVDVWLHLRC